MTEGSSPPPAEFDLFVSYAHVDDADDWVTVLVEVIKEEFRAFSGRDLNTFFDKTNIENIYKCLKQAKVMLAVLSPAYVASAFCQHEWRIFLEHEIARAMLDQGGIANLYYVTVPGVMGGEPGPKVAAWLRDVNRRQMDKASGCDARKWRDGGIEAIQREDVRKRLRKLSEQIDHRIKLVGRVIESPTTIPPYNRRSVE